MYTKAELREFLALLLAVAMGNGLSATLLGDLLGLSPATSARWLRMARTVAAGTDPDTSVYRFMADPARKKLLRLEELNGTENLFAVVSTEKPQRKAALLKAALANQVV